MSVHSWAINPNLAARKAGKVGKHMEYLQTPSLPRSELQSLIQLSKLSSEISSSCYVQFQTQDFLMMFSHLPSGRDL